MKASLHFELVVYGVLLAGLGALAHWFAPDFGAGPLVIGLVGGGLVILWGGLGLSGFRRRLWPIVTLVAVNGALLAQTCSAWQMIRGGLENIHRVAAILTVLLACGVVELINFVKGGGEG